MYAAAQSGSWSQRYTRLQNTFVVYIGAVVDNAHISHTSLGCHNGSSQNLYTAPQTRLRADAGKGVNK